MQHPKYTQSVTLRVGRPLEGSAIQRQDLHQQTPLVDAKTGCRRLCCVAQHFDTGCPWLILTAVSNEEWWRGWAVGFSPWLGRFRVAVGLRVIQGWLSGWGGCRVGSGFVHKITHHTRKCNCKSATACFFLHRHEWAVGSASAWALGRLGDAGGRGKPNPSNAATEAGKQTQFSRRKC